MRVREFLFAAGLALGFCGLAWGVPLTADDFSFELRVVSPHGRGFDTGLGLADTLPSDGERRRLRAGERERALVAQFDDLRPLLGAGGRSPDPDAEEKAEKPPSIHDTSPLRGEARARPRGLTYLNRLWMGSGQGSRWSEDAEGLTGRARPEEREGEGRYVGPR